MHKMRYLINQNPHDKVISKVDVVVGMDSTHSVSAVVGDHVKRLTQKSRVLGVTPPNQEMVISVLHRRTYMHVMIPVVAHDASI